MLQWAAAAAIVFLHSSPIAQTGALENPAPNGIESGIGVISGWHCTGKDIEFRIDGASLGRAGSGTSRKDTEAVCGRSDTGFSLLFNYNLLSQGTHRIEALADGMVFAASEFRVGTLDGEFLTNLSRPITVPDFPGRGTSANMRWAQSKQNFVIEGSGPTNSLPLPGNYVLSQFSVIYDNGAVVTSSTPGLTFAGTMVVRPDGTSTQTVEVTIGTGSVGFTTDGTLVDHGYYLDVTSGGGSFRCALLSRGNVLTTQVLMPAPEGFSEVDVWTRSATGTGAASPASQTKSYAGVVHTDGPLLPFGLLGILTAKLPRS
jgi:hypothetical protein